MIVHVFDWNSPYGHDKAVDVSDTVVRDFIRFVMRTNGWKDQPEAAFDRLLKFRRELVESARDIVVTDTAVERVEPLAAERPRRARAKKGADAE